MVEHNLQIKNENVHPKKHGSSKNEIKPFANNVTLCTILRSMALPRHTTSLQHFV